MISTLWNWSSWTGLETVLFNDSVLCSCLVFTNIVYFPFTFVKAMTNAMTTSFKTIDTCIFSLGALVVPGSIW